VFTPHRISGRLGDQACFVEHQRGRGPTRPASIWLLARKHRRETAGARVRPCSRATCTRRAASRCKASSSHISSATMLLFRPLETESHRLPSSLAMSVGEQKAREARGECRRPLPRIRRFKRIANASSTTSTARNGTVPGGAGPAGGGRDPPARRRRPQRRWPWRPRGPRGTSRGLARGRVARGGSPRSENRRPASPPRRCSCAIWARKRSTRARARARRARQPRRLPTAQGGSLQIACIALGGGRRRAGASHGAWARV